jgi:hypothetical protein
MMVLLRKRLTNSCLSLVLAALVTTTHAGTPQAGSLRACVGQGYAALRSTAVPSGPRKTDEVCLVADGLTVCRRLLQGDRGDGNTMAVSIQSPGQEVQHWLEDGDPGYLAQFHAYRAHQGHAEEVIVATQQSETQGMGAQEWVVNVVRWGEHLPATRHAVTTAEFGATGALVMAKAPAGGACHLLHTRWESHPSAQGQRLFLVGQLLDLAGDMTGPPATASFSRRLDRRFERQREAPPDGRPLIYFQP